MALRYIPFIGALMTLSIAGPAAAQRSNCDKTCLENIGDQYRAAYVKHDPSLAPIAKNVRFTENNVEMKFPDATWDTVTEEVGPALTISDPKTGNIGIFTSIMQNDTPGFLGIRLKVERGKIVEIEHIISTKRNLSAPPTPIGDVQGFHHIPGFADPIPEGQRVSREKLIAHADGYFNTLQNNTGEIRGTRFSPDAMRFENGMRFDEIEKGFKLGRYRFNERVRRDHIMVDEERGIVLSRGFIDHKGVLDEYTLTDGTKTRSIFREPHSWGLLEMFKVRNDMIVGVEATFVTAPYNMRSPWSKRDQR